MMNEEKDIVAWLFEERNPETGKWTEKIFRRSPRDVFSKFEHLDNENLRNVTPLVEAERDSNQDYSSRCPECGDLSIMHPNQRVICKNCRKNVVMENLETNDESTKEKQFKIDNDKQIRDKSINEWRDEIHSVAREKGWWDEERSFGDIISLIHSELSEALEEHREDNDGLYFDDGKPEGTAVELIDTIIRILDYCGKEDIDVEEILRKKMEYNKGREYRHGGKKL